jgi:phasin family protein
MRVPRLARIIVPLTQSRYATPPGPDWAVSAPDRPTRSFIVLTKEQVTEIRNASLERFFELNNTAVEGIGKLAELNLQTVRATLTDAFDLAQKSLSVTEPQDWLALQDRLAAPMAERVQTYCRQVFEIVLATQAGIARIGKAQYETCGNQLKSVVKDAVKHAPTGSEAAMTVLDSAISAASTLYETLQSSGQQAIEVTRSNLDMAAAVSRSAGRASDPGSQGAQR